MYILGEAFRKHPIASDKATDVLIYPMQMRSLAVYGSKHVLNPTQAAAKKKHEAELAKQKKALPYAQKIVKTLKDTKSFKNVDIVEEKEISSKNTKYKIRITR